MENFSNLVEDYAKKLHAVDYWSGSVKSSAILNPAYEAKNKLKAITEDTKVWELINDYAKKLHQVDYWSGNIKNSALLDPAYEAKKKLELAMATLEPKSVNNKIKPF